MAFELPPLPFDTNALAANGMCQETLELHHGKHHQAYVTALNGFVEKDSSLAGKSLDEIVTLTASTPGPVFNNAGQHWNHIIFWKNLSPTGGKIPGALAKKIDEDLGGLVLDKGGKLAVTKTPNGSNPLATGEGKVLLALDVWEHSYYLDFRNRRPDYVTNYLEKLANYEYAEAELHAA
jgi:Fe-Mn family superoxide dismutase